MSRRRVRPDELELWSQIARSAKPLPGSLKSRKLSPSEPTVPNSRPSKPVTENVSPFSMGAKAPDHTETHYFPKTAADRLHALNLSAALVWTHCTGTHLVGEIAAAVGQAFDRPAPEDEIVRDVESAVARFRAEGLLA